MIKILMGEKGSGKTKAFIEMVNKATEQENGNVVCIENGNRHLFDVKSSVRLSDTSEFKTDSYDLLTGYVSGILSRDYDITHMFIDSITKITGRPVAESDMFISELERLSEKLNVNFTLTISANLNEATDKIKPYLV